MKNYRYYAEMAIHNLALSLLAESNQDFLLADYYKIRAGRFGAMAFKLKINLN